MNADGYREILGLQVTSAEDGAGWLGFFRDLVARGLSGVSLVTTDAPPRPRGGDRRHFARRQLATMPATMTEQTEVLAGQVEQGLGQHPVAKR